MVELKLIEVPEKIFDKILEIYPSKIKFVKDIWSYFCGSPDDKKTIYTDQNEWIVCQEYILDYVSQLIFGKDCITGCTNWKQVRVRKVIGLNHVQQTYNGSYCYNYIIKILSKYYSLEEIDEIFNSHSAEYDKSLAQYHHYYDCDAGELVEFNNCVKYDINGAHASAVIKLFPKAKDDLLELYSKKDKLKQRGDLDGANKVKALFNYFVGMLCKKGYRCTYNYIVQSITKQLLDMRHKVGGMLIYANTDSFCVKNPINVLKPSTELGEFKLEGFGDMYVYKDTNYWLLEYTDTKGNTEQVGSCKLKVRDRISLKNRKVVHYKVEREFLGLDKNGRAHYQENITNIREETI